MSKGAATSAIMCSEAIGTIVHSLVAAYIVNPDNKETTIISDHGNVQYSYFDSEVANNIPVLFRWFPCVEIFIMAFALYFIWLPPYELPKEDEIKMPWNIEPTEAEKLSIVLRSRQFFQTYAMMACTVLYVGYITNIFKPFGVANGHDD